MLRGKGGKGGNKIHAFLSTADQMYVVVLSRSTLLIVCFVSLSRLAVHVYFVLPFTFTPFCRSRTLRLYLSSLEGTVGGKKSRQEEAGARGRLYYEDTNGVVPPVSASVSPGV